MARRVLERLRRGARIVPQEEKARRAADALRTWWPLVLPLWLWIVRRGLRARRRPGRG